MRRRGDGRSLRTNSRPKSPRAASSATSSMGACAQRANDLKAADVPVYAGVLTGATSMILADSRVRTGCWIGQHPVTLFGGQPAVGAEEFDEGPAGDFKEAPCPALGAGLVPAD